MFEYPPGLRTEGESLGFAEQHIITNPVELPRELMDPFWRGAPGLAVAPANSQVFGSLVRDSGIQAILFKSTRDVGPCLAIFPENFEGTNSFVELQDDPPIDAPGTIRRLDKTTWRMLI
jgi:hypothetical protein